jgi:hypothetical protein
MTSNFLPSNKICKLFPQPWSVIVQLVMRGVSSFWETVRADLLRVLSGLHVLTDRVLI